MTQPTHHAEQVRRMSGFVLQTMRDRGMGCDRADLERAMLELTPEQVARVHTAAIEVGKGVDSHDLVGVLAALRTICGREARRALADAGVMHRADVLLPVATSATTGPELRRELARLRREDLAAAEREQARSALTGLCGAVFHVLDEHVPPLPAPPELPAAALPAGIGSAAPDRAGPETAAAPESPQAPAPSRPKRPRQVKIFGKAAALTCEAAPARQKDNGDAERAMWTVMIEGATARGDGSFDWSAKIVFACAQRELPQLLAVLLGWHDAAEFRFHGGRSGKELLLQHQQHGVFVRLREDGQTIAVPLVDADRYALAMLTASVMARNDAGGDLSAVLAVCRDVMCPRPASRPGRP